MRFIQPAALHEFHSQAFLLKISLFSITRLFNVLESLTHHESILDLSAGRWLI